MQKLQTSLTATTKHCQIGEEKFGEFSSLGDIGESHLIGKPGIQH